jgi:hypothetical protein
MVLTPDFSEDETEEKRTREKEGELRGQRSEIPGSRGQDDKRTLISDKED